jgi:hypothetical protein
MNKHILPLALAATALLLGGCLPEEFIWWSPTGQVAAVRTPDGLRLTGTNGQLSAVILPGEIQSAAWLPDGSSLVVSRAFKLTNWTAIEKLIPREEAVATMQMARAVPDLLKAGLLASGGSWDDLVDKFLKPLGMTESPALEPAFFCALSRHREQIVAAIAGFTNVAALQAELVSAETNGLSVCEISILPMRSGRATGQPRALIRSVRPLLDIVLSPHDPILAFRTGDGALKAMTLDGGSSLVVAGEGVASAAWSADGRALIHVVMGKSDKWGEIRSRTVVKDSGELLQSAPQAETLAMAAFAFGASTRLSVLPDGRLLFASVPITLPARAASINPGAQFFLLDPGRSNAAPVAVRIKEGSLPDDLSAFAPSPDGRFVAVGESGTDVVAVLELATGKVKIISPLHGGWKSHTIPAWRNPRELTFAAPPSDSATRPELILWQTGAPQRVLSKDWPDGVVKPWLDAPRTGNDRPTRQGP